LGGLIEATTLAPCGAGYTATLDPVWDIWGPAGGYIAAIALRAARERAAAGHRPVSIMGQFVRVAKPGNLDVQIAAVKEGASSLFSVTLAQEGNPIFLAQIWTTARNDASLPITPTMPDVPAPFALRDQDEIAAERGVPTNKFWRNLEGRPVHFRLHSDPPAPMPTQLRWLRFREWSAGEDLFYDAMRTALLIDLGIWPGHWHKLTETASYLAPSLDLTVYFHGSEPAGDWLLSDADSDVSGNGLISGRVRIWSQDGRALATGSGHCLVTVPRKSV
jgi:acyl-CoA thioesterase II